MDLIREHTIENTDGIKKEIILEEVSPEQYKLTVNLNDDIVEKENKEIRKQLHDEKGFTKDRTKRYIGRFPWYIFMKEPLLREYLDSKHENPEYAQKCIKTWLNLNPTYRIGSGRI
jgi:hypothetical protein